MKWFRVWPGYVINGTTFKELNAEARGVWFSLLALAGYSPIPGCICIGEGIPYTDEQLSKILLIPPKILHKWIGYLMSPGINKISRGRDGILKVVNWSKYQTEYDRQKPYRKGLHKKVTGESYKVETETETDTDKDKDKKIYSDRFMILWTEYPKKIGKGEALKVFSKVNPDDSLLDVMLSKIKEFKQTPQWMDNGGRFIPHLATWLSQRRWEDEGMFCEIKLPYPDAVPPLPENAKRDPEGQRKVRELLRQIDKN